MGASSVGNGSPVELIAGLFAGPGGPMSQAEVAGFEALPHAAAAVAVRRWDDQAKDPAAPVPPFGRFRPLLDSLAGS
jgi:predicted HD phosphohydrolase